VEKNLLRSLSPVKKNESHEATDFLNSFLSTSEEKPMIFPSRTISRTVSTYDDERDYKPSSELLDMFNTLPDGLSSTTRKDVVVKSETFNTVLPFDKNSSSGDRERSMFPPDDRNSQSSRDPRKRPMSSVTPIKNERNLDAEDEESVKRLKMYR